MSDANTGTVVRAVSASGLGTARLLVDGKSIDGDAGVESPVFDPSTGAVVGQVAVGSASDVDMAVTAARAAHDDGRWRGLAAAEREAVLRKAADRLEAAIDEIAAIESLNNGRTQAAARGAIAASIAVLRYFAGWPTKLDGRSVHGFRPGGDGFAYTRREPVGVVAAIAAWNAPTQLAIWKLAPALAAGCPCVLKPALETPFTALRIAEALQEAGLPPGILNVVTGGRDAGTALVSHPLVAAITFTGSTATGRAIAAAAGQGLKRVSLELGGKGPVIVLEDADLDAAADNVIAGIFDNAGQVCVAGSRVLIAASIRDAFLDRLIERTRRLRVGPGSDPNAQVGPLITEAHRRRVTAMVDGAAASGVTIALGGHALARPGFFMEPTIFVEPDADTPIVRDEVFGPVLVTAKFDDTDEAVRLANTSPYGLGATVWTRGLNEAHAVAARLDAGMVWLNGRGASDPALPFGGVKASGYGRDNSAEALDNYLATKTVALFNLGHR